MYRNDESMSVPRSCLGAFVAPPLAGTNHGAMKLPRD